MTLPIDERNARIAGGPFVVTPVGFVKSPLSDLASAPRQGREGAPDCWIELKEPLLSAAQGIEEGDDLVIVTWLHRAQRDVLRVHPRSEASLPLTGVFATRSPDRPNPLGLHRVTVREIDGERLRVGPLEAIDGTPVIDIKIALPAVEDGV